MYFEQLDRNYWQKSSAYSLLHADFWHNSLSYMKKEKAICSSTALVNFHWTTNIISQKTEPFMEAVVTTSNPIKNSVALNPRANYTD
jgi:hypothetical protein